MSDEEDYSFAVSRREMESARDALVRHSEIWERTDLETVLVFEELIRQLRQEPQKPKQEELN